MQTSYFHRSPRPGLLLPILLLAGACGPDDEAATGEEAMAEDPAQMGRPASAVPSDGSM